MLFPFHQRTTPLAPSSRLIWLVKESSSFCVTVPLSLQMIMATFLSENTKKVPKSRSLCRFSEIFNWKFLFHLILLREFLQFSFKSFALRNSRKFYGINFRTKEKRPRNITVLLKFTDILTNYFLDCIQQIFIGGSSCFVTQLVSHGPSVDNNNTGPH